MTSLPSNPSGRTILCRLGFHRWRDQHGWPLAMRYVGYAPGSTRPFHCTRCGLTMTITMRKAKF